MLDWQLLFNNALNCGLVLCVVLTIQMAISGAVALDLFVGDYPPDIRRKYGPMSLRAARLRPYIASLFVITILVIPTIGLFALQGDLLDVPFFAALVFSGITLLVFNIFDLLVLDWLVFCTIRPRAMVLPGTEGLAGYGDYRFHFIGFLKGLGFTAAGSLLIATCWTALQWFITRFAVAA